MLALLEFDLRGCADLDDGDAAGQLGQTLLQLLAVVVAVGVVDLGPDLVHTALNLLRVARTLNDGRLVLGDDHLASATEEVEGCVLQLQADLFADDLTTGEDGDVLQHGLTAIAEARSLDSDRTEGAANLVHHERGEGFSLEILSDDRQRLAGLHDLFQNGDEVLHRGNLRVHDEHIRVFELGLHAFCISDEVGRDVTLVEAHALGELELEAEGLALLHGDDAFFADLVHSFSDELTDLGVATGRNGSGGCDLLFGLDVLRHGEELVGDDIGRLLDTALETHGVRAGSDVAQAFTNECLGQHGCGGGAVASDIVGLLGDLFDELSTDLLVGILEIDLLGDGHTIIGDRGGAPLLLENDVAALRAQGDLHGVGEHVHAALERPPGLLVECNHF